MLWFLRQKLGRGAQLDITLIPTIPHSVLLIELLGLQVNVVQDKVNGTTLVPNNGLHAVKMIPSIANQVSIRPLA